VNNELLVNSDTTEFLFVKDPWSVSLGSDLLASFQGDFAENIEVEMVELEGDVIDQCIGRLLDNMVEPKYESDSDNEDD